MPADVPVVLYYDGKHYDARVGAYDVDLAFWKKRARSCGSPILELACGTGRVTIPLALDGHALTGLDLSAGMLEQARRKARAADVEIAWARGDCRDFDLGQKFAMIFFPFNSLTHLHTLEDLERCLACVKRHLAPGGRFIFDIFNPSLAILMRDPTKRYPHSIYLDPEGGGTIEVTENNVYDARLQINTVRLYFKMPDGSEGRGDLVLRIWYPQEMDAALKYNGLAIEHKFGDFDESPFEASSPRQVFVTALASS
ncbi:MAG: class I SAM-dependent methyltransferase [bacterium]